MKKYIISLIICLFASGFILAQKGKYAVYGIAFYNLENLFDTINSNGSYDMEFSPQGSRQWNSKKYWKKQHNMAYVLEQMANKYIPQGPAIVGLCELENLGVLKDLVEQKPIKNRNYHIIHFDSPDKRGIDVALLYNPKMFKVLSTNNHRLTIDSKPNFKTRDQLVVTGLLGGDKISFIINHWPSRLGGETQSSPLREAAASLTLLIADSLLNEDPNAGIIIMGDMNDDPVSKSIKEVLGAKKNIEEVPENGYFNPFWYFYDKGIGTLAYDGNWNLFDQIILSANLLNNSDGLNFWKAEVFNKPFLTTKEGDYKGYPARTYAGGVFLNGYSDHFPTLIYLTQKRK